MIKEQRFTQVYRRRKNLILRYAYSKTQDLEAAEEICQDVFLHYYEKIEQIQEDLVKAWLLLCAKRKCIDYWRKRQNRQESSVGETAVLEVISENNLERVVDHVIQENFAWKILGELRQKNETWYQVIEAVCICEMEQEEAAASLGISVQVLRARLFRARKFIRQEYLKEYKDLLDS
ncbi:MAG TPA: sigma-70 family RNA polymerase sigma factor [Candidatus Limivivens intestinipullorum]|uniref:Sigma-70 family RNA polymerase sigma factor n=1 Tax=Candidatus Limivivens intestinipullorum TaxID=2840858 RepID=A0A9D1JJ57_9FIRM|nr:sigma-70 family RNA polymerase sigma factor [Candidatus Limivivens intestinipullorum]